MTINALIPLSSTLISAICLLETLLASMKRAFLYYAAAFCTLNQNSSFLILFSDFFFTAISVFLIINNKYYFNTLFYEKFGH
jgi:hypothetical protein